MANTIAKSAVSKIIEAVQHRLQKEGRPRISAQTLFIRVAQSAGFKCRRHLVSEFTAVKPIVATMVANGLLDFHYVEGGTSFYTVNGVDPATGNSAHPAGEASAEIDPHHLPDGEDSLHLQALQLLAKKVWHVNLPRLEKAKEMNAKGHVFDEGTWRAVEKDDETLKAQAMVIAAVSVCAERTDNRMSFDVFADHRGRLYIRGGYACPQNSHLSRWLFSADDEVSLDHRTSFAQNYSLLTGDNIGRYCGVGSAEGGDFWAGMLAQYGIAVKPHSIHRQACKAFGMPMFYGASVDTAKDKAEPLLEKAVKAAEISSEESEETLKALEKVGEGLKSFGERVRAFVGTFTMWGEHPAWVTPSGYHACQKYHTREAVVWNSGENEVWAYPKSMTIQIETRRICERPRKDVPEKSVLVATTANILQSLDASIMAMTICKFYEQTGLILAPVHDAYIVPKEYAAVLTACVVDSMRELADSEQLKTLRRELNLPPVKVITGKARPSSGMRNLDLREMNPLDEE